jgi:hypothetical protein
VGVPIGPIDLEARVALLETIIMGVQNLEIRQFMSALDSLAARNGRTAVSDAQHGGGHDSHH